MKYKVRDYQISQLFSGMGDEQCTSLLDRIPLGQLDGERIGRKITIKAIEFRFRCWNQLQDWTMQESYEWTGVSGITATTRTIPAVAVPTDAWSTLYYDTVGLPACALIATAIAGPGATGPTISTLVSTELNDSLGPASGFDLQASQTSVVNQPAFPAFPGWIASNSNFKKGHVGGEMTSVRILFFTDETPLKPYETPGDLAPRALDVVEAGVLPGLPVPTLAGVYKYKNLTRFTPIIDATWDPYGAANEVICVRPPKRVCIPVTYPQYDPAVSVTLTPTYNNLYFIPMGTDPFYPGSTSTIYCIGFIRLFYEDE